MNEGEVKTKNNLKRILSILTIIVMLISMFTPYSIVFASNLPTVEIYTDSTSLTVGDTIDVNVKISGTGEDYQSIYGVLDYDNTVFSYVAMTSPLGRVIYNDVNKQFTVTSAAGYQTIPNDIILTITLDVITTTSTSVITLRDTEFDGSVEFYDSSIDASFAAISGTVPKAAATHTVTYDYATNGGVSSTVTTDTVAENAAIDLTPTATKTDWNFVGWNTDSTATTGLTSLNMGTSDVTLYAIYSKDLTATCNYYDNTATAQTQTVTGTMYNNDTSANVTLPTLTVNYVDANNKTWTRNGWTTSTDANPSTTVSEGDIETISSDTNYYMSYSRAIRISYNTNGGSIAPTEQTGTIYTNSNAITSIKGADILVDSSTPVKAGYTFNGWKDSNSVSYSGTKTFTDDTVLYADWTANTNTPYTVEHYKQKADGTYNTVADETENGVGTTGTTATASPKTYDGYTYDTNSVATGTIAGDGSLVIKLYYTANQTTPYIVEHYKQNPDGSYNAVADETENKTGITGAIVTAVAKTYDGYTEDASNVNREASGAIKGDGSLVLKLYYSANTNTPYIVEHYKQNPDGSYNAVADETENKTGITGDTVTAVAKTYDGYTEDTSNVNREETGVIAGNGSLVLKLYYTANTNTPYTVEHYTEQPNGSYVIDSSLTENLTGTTGDNATATPQTIIGYTENTTHTDRVASGVIAGDGSLVLRLYYKANTDTPYTVEHYKQNADGSYNAVADETENLQGATGFPVTAVAKTYDGYTEDIAHSDRVASGTVLSNGSLVLKLYYKANTDTPYTVEHYKQNADGSYNAVADETENKTGTTGATVTAVAKTYDGYTEDTSNVNREETGVIAGNGSLVLRLYYKANTNTPYTVEHYTEQPNGSYVIDSSLTENLTGTTGANVTATPQTITGYTVDTSIQGTEESGAIKGDGSLVLRLYYKANTDTPYTVEHYKQNPDGTYNSVADETENLQGATGFTVTAVAKTYDGYTEDIAHSDRVESGTVLSNGSLVLKLYYKLNEYTVTFKDDNGTVLDTQTIKHGQAAIAPSDPSKPADAQYTYTFDGWDKAFNNVTSDLEVNATYAQTINKYTVTFKDDDGTVIDTQTVDYGSSATAPQDPTKTGDAQYSYTFAGWDKAFNNITGDLEVNATYTQTVNQYTITFYDEDGTTKLGESTVDYGLNATAPTAIKTEDNTYTYTFDKWVTTQGGMVEDDLSNVIADRNVYATYTATYKEYEVEFVDENGTQINTKLDYHYGDPIVLPSNPTKPADAQYTYTFEGWSEDGINVIDLSTATVDGNKQYKAVYSSTVNQYTVTFYDKDGITVLGTSTVDYGNSAIAPTLTIPQDTGYTTTLDKWVDISNNEDDLSNVIANRDVYAVYAKVANVYTITYANTQNADNSYNPNTYTIEDLDITLKPLGQKIGMTFVGWYTDSTFTTPISSITLAELGNITVCAKWDIASSMYFVKDQASDDNNTLASDRIYDNFDNAKEYVDNLFDNGNGVAIGIYDLNNDLVYYPELHPLYYVIEDDGTVHMENEDFEDAKAYVDSLFSYGTILKIYDEAGKLVYEPKEEVPQVEYFVKINDTDANTAEGTFANFSDAKEYADQNVKNGFKVFDINGEIVYEPKESLYLKSDEYKIGENLINEYEENDLYLYRINANTTLAEFIANCDTNGTITVYKQDGTILQDDELVGTGMILKDELNGEKITLTLSVIGDANGNGRIDTGDLTALRGHLYEENNKFEGVYFKAMDIYERNTISTKDLTAIRSVLYEGNTL